MEKLIEVVRKFSKEIGYKININKSVSYYINKEWATKSNMGRAWLGEQKI